MYRRKNETRNQPAHKILLKRQKALDSFTLTLEKGVYGILGPNGAGKSTLINCVTGIIKPDSGSIAFYRR